MIQRSSNAFRVDTNTNDINVESDINIFAGQQYISVRGGGATIVDLLNLAPEPQQKWSLQSVAIQAYMLIELSSSAGVSALYGKMNKIVGGLILPPYASLSGNSNFPSNQPMRALPSDPSLTVTLWDPAIDQMPPMVPISTVTSQSSPSKMLPINGVLQLPQPLPLEPGVEIGVGIWILPALIGFANLNNGQVTFSIEVRRATYAIAYDNGL